MLRASILGFAGVLAGCGNDTASTPACTDDRCDVARSRDELLAAVDGHADPMAAYLRLAASERGTLTGDYRDVLAGVGEQLGCDASSERSFVVLSNQSFVPKPILTRCSTDAVAAS